MAPKRPSPSDDPPSVSSSDQEPQQAQSQDQEAESEDPEQEQEESSDDDDDQQPNQPPIENKKTTSSLSAEGSDSGAEAESEPPSQPLVDLHVKPISSKPNRPDPAITALPAPKRAKRDDHDAAAAASDPGVKRGKHLFKRLWTEEDEIVIMKGILDYCASKNKTFDPPNDVSACFECIKHNLESQGTRKQLMNKLGKLKFKYLNNAAKGRVFTNAHEQLTYDLSAQIWGGSSSGGSGASKNVVRPVDVPRSNGKAKAMPTIKKCENVPLPTQNVKEEGVVSTQGPSNGSSSRKGNLIECDLFSMSLRSIELDKNFMRRGIDLINSTKKLELEERWRKLHVVEMELFLRRTELIREQTKLMLDAYKKP